MDFSDWAKEEKDIQIIDNEPLFKLRKKREASSTAAQGIVDGVDGRWMCVWVERGEGEGGD